MKYGIDEQETFIRFDPTTRKWSYQTNFHLHVNALLKYIDENKNSLTVVKTEKDESGTITYIEAIANDNDEYPMPSNKFIRSILPKKKRKMSEEDRKKAVARLKNAKH